MTPRPLFLALAVAHLAVVCAGCSVEDHAAEPSSSVSPTPTAPAPRPGEEGPPAAVWVTREAGGIVSIARTWGAETGAPIVNGARVTASFFGQRVAVAARPAEGTCLRGTPAVVSGPSIDAGELAVDDAAGGRGQGILVRPNEEHHYSAAFENLAVAREAELLVAATGAAFPSFQQRVSWAPTAAALAVTARRAASGAIEVAWPGQAQTGAVLVTLRAGEGADGRTLETCSAGWAAGRITIDPVPHGLGDSRAIVHVDFITATQVQLGVHDALFELRDVRELIVD